MPWLVLGSVAGLIGGMFVEPHAATARDWTIEAWRSYALIWCPIVGVLVGASLEMAFAVVKRARRERHEDPFKWALLIFSIRWLLITTAFVAALLAWWANVESLRREHERERAAFQDWLHSPTSTPRPTGNPKPIDIGGWTVLMQRQKSPPPRMDATSEESIERSLKAMNDTLDETGKWRLVRARDIIAFDEAYKPTASNKTGVTDIVDECKVLHGMTADEIIQKAADITERDWQKIKGIDPKLDPT